MARLARGLAIAADETQEAGIVQFFELAFELSWKTCKDYLEAEEGLNPDSPRQAIQLTFANGLLADGHIWLEALEARNLMAHTYDEPRMREALRRIRTAYAPAIGELIAVLRAR